jgi:predicted esterase
MLASSQWPVCKRVMLQLKRLPAILLSSLCLTCSSGQTEMGLARPYRTSGPAWKVAVFPVQAPTEGAIARVVDSDLLKLISEDRRFQVVPVEQWKPLFPDARGLDLRPDVARTFKDKLDVDVIVASSIEEARPSDFEEYRAANPPAMWPTHTIRFVLTNTASGRQTLSAQPGYSFRLEQVPGRRRPAWSVYQELMIQWNYASPTAPRCVVPGDLPDEWDDAFGWRRNHDGWQPAAAGEIGNITPGQAPEKSYPYYLYEPAKHESTGWSYPLIIYLHGTSARSDTLSPTLFYASPLDGLQNTVGVAANPFVINQLDPRLRSSFVLMPQLHRSGDPSWDADALNRVVVQILKQFPIDSRRVYLTGISRGGAGAWAYGAGLYSRLAAIAPLAGSIIYQSPVDCYGDTPIWTFHAFDDSNVGLWQVLTQLESILPGPLYFGDVNLLRDYPHQGGDPRLPADDDYTIAINGTPGPWRKGTPVPDGRIGLTIYRTGNHAIFSRTYAKKEFWDWMFAQKRE